MTDEIEYTVRLKNGKTLTVRAEDMTDMHKQMAKKGEAKKDYYVVGWLRLSLPKQQGFPEIY